MRSLRNRHGHEVRIVRRGQKFADLPVRHADENQSGLHIGRLVRGMICGKWGSDAERERRAMAENINTAGGYMVGEE